MFVRPNINKSKKEASKRNLKLKKLSSESEESEGSAIELDDPCAARQEEAVKEPQKFRTPGLDPRFQQQNQTLRCYIMYTDFFQCEHILGEGHEACKWFKDVYMSICPSAWVEQWDDFRAEGRMPWFKNTDFPKAPYGK